MRACLESVDELIPHGRALQTSIQLEGGGSRNGSVFVMPAKLLLGGEWSLAVLAFDRGIGLKPLGIGLKPLGTTKWLLLLIARPLLQNPDLCL